MSAGASTTTVTWGGYSIITGVLTDVTTDPAQAAAGEYVGIVYPRELTYYHFYFPGHGAALAAIVSPRLTIHVKPALSVPSAPSSARANAWFTVAGTLKPRFPGGDRTVTIKIGRYNGHSWVLYKNLKAENANSGLYTRYSLQLKIGSKGKYRFSASTAATTLYAAGSTTTSSPITIK